jgi:carbonic anhydrase
MAEEVSEPPASDDAVDEAQTAPGPTAKLAAALKSPPMAKAVAGARYAAANPDARRFVAGALVGALALYAGTVVFGGSSESADPEAGRVEALRADLAELRADLAEFKAAGATAGSAAAHETASVDSDTTHDTAGDAGATDEPAAHGVEPPHWTYAEADDWGAIADEFIECTTGREQSPIDLSTSWDHVENTSEVHYEAVPITVLDNGHTIQVNAEGAGSVSQQRHEYTLVQFHFHAPSEHTIDGEHHDAEVHLVHKDADGMLAVVGVMIDEGAALEGFDAILDSIGAPGREESAGAFDPTVLLPDARDFFHYRGSLTTPPCSEGVAWRVMTEPIKMSAAQIDELTSHFAEPNNRPVQARHDREAHVDA